MDKWVGNKYELFQGYIDVCNRALEINKNRFPFKQILGTAQKTGEDRLVEVKIVDDGPGSDFVIGFDKNKIKGDLHGDCPHCRCEGQWRVSRSYMEDVVRNPDAYIKNPAKLDWEWMYERKD